MTIRGERQRKKRDEGRGYVQSILKFSRCRECGLADFRVLDFHHDEALMELHGPKVRGISEMVSKGVDIGLIRAEIRKCVVLCSNCHRIHHWEERNA